MINAVVNQPFSALLSDYTPGVAAELRVEVYDPATGATILAASGTGVTEPRAGTYRVSRTVPTAGSFQLRWSRTGLSADINIGEEPIIARVVAIPVSPDSIRPSLDDVGAILRARTAVMGTEKGTFDDTTRPTGTEVDELVDMAVAELALLLPDNIPDRYLLFAQRLVALRTAMAIEISYDPDRLEADSTAYDRLKDMYDSGLRALLDGIADRDQGVTRRIASIPVVSPTLAPYHDELRELIAPDPYPWP